MTPERERILRRHRWIERGALAVAWSIIVGLLVLIWLK
jgi:hypothetical protein